MQKDNFTDVVENLPQAPAPTPAPAQPAPEQQVMTSEGETVTLGQ